MGPCREQFCRIFGRERENGKVLTRLSDPVLIPSASKSYGVLTAACGIVSSHFSEVGMVLYCR